MFPRTKAAWQRLKAAWRDYRAAVFESRTQRITYTNMTPEQQAHFDAAFRHMNKAFEELRKL